MTKARLKLVSPATEKRTVAPVRRPNAELRPREHLTEREVEKLIEAAKGNRWGQRDASMILFAFRHGLRASELSLKPAPCKQSGLCSLDVLLRRMSSCASAMAGSGSGSGLCFGFRRQLGFDRGGAVLLRRGIRLDGGAHGLSAGVAPASGAMALLPEPYCYRPSALLNTDRHACCGEDDHEQVEGRVARRAPRGRRARRGPGLAGRGAVTQPPQPKSGPGGSDYPHRGWRVSSAGAAPTRGTCSSRPGRGRAGRRWRS